MATDLPKALPPSEGISSPKARAKKHALKRLVHLLARQAAREVIASGVALSPNSTKNDGVRQRANRPTPGRQVAR